MKTYLTSLIGLLGIFATSQLNAADFSRSYIPDELLTEFKIPLDDYLFLLSKSSGYEYKSGEKGLKCEPFEVPFYTNKLSLISVGELKTVHDHLKQLGFIIPKGYSIEIHVKEKLIKLSCAAKLSTARE